MNQVFKIMANTPLNWPTGSRIVFTELLAWDFVFRLHQFLKYMKFMNRFFLSDCEHFIKCWTIVQLSRFNKSDLFLSIIWSGIFFFCKKKTSMKFYYRKLVISFWSNLFLKYWYLNRTVIMWILRLLNSLKSI